MCSHLRAIKIQMETSWIKFLGWVEPAKILFHSIAQHQKLSEDELNALKSLLTVFSLLQAQEESGRKWNALASLPSKCISSISPTPFPVDGLDAGEQHHDGPRLLLLAHLPGCPYADEGGHACLSLDLLFTPLSPGPSSSWGCLQVKPQTINPNFKHCNNQ